MRIRHVISTVGPSAPAELVVAQDLTLRSIERALRCVDPGLDVDVRAVRFPDEPVDCDWITDCPLLERSILDMAEFQVPRRLPLLHDVLDGLGDSSDYDLAVFTNVDIAVQPLFYELLAELAAEGNDAFTITRRTVQPRFRGSTLSRLSTASSSVHPGHDCLAMAPSVVDELIPTESALGVGFVALPLLWQMQLNARRFRQFGDLHATFHVGDDRVWADPRLDDYQQWNSAQARKLALALVDRFGRRRVSRVAGAKRFLDAADKGEEVALQPQRTGVYGLRPKAGPGPRLVFAANSGRSGSAYLSSLLDAAPYVSAGHERAPAMEGSWTRRVAYEPRMKSYADRLVKADAIRVEAEQLPSNWAYADTSHMFVKTFADVVLDEFSHERISVIVLRRDPVDVARSFYQLDYFGARPRPWHDWIIPPTASESAFPLDPDEIDDQFDLIFGYLVDIENRTQRLRALAPAVNWVDVRLDEITEVRGAAAMFRSLRLTPPADMGEAVALKVNAKGKTKDGLDQPVTRQRVEQRLTEFLERHGGRQDLSAFVQSHGLDAS